MKKIIIFCLNILFYMTAFGQVPQGISYQAVAYDISGNIVSSPDLISLEISIYDNSPTGTIVYKEIFTQIEPNIQGVFSLNIGQGIPQSPFDGNSFKNISWGVNSKFLEVKIDTSSPTTGLGTNYTVIGSNQLMSVPYALYSQNSSPDNTITTLKDINELKYFTNFDPGVSNVTVYVQGYNFPSDGGGGIFIFKRYDEMNYTYDSTSNTLTYIPYDPPNGFFSDDGVFFDSYNQGLRDEGIWIRQFNGEIDIRYYGAVGNSENCTEKIQRAIDYASKSVVDVNSRPYGFNKSNIVFFPNGAYAVDQLILKAGVTLKGSSKEHTVIIPNPQKDDEIPLIVIDQGFVKDVHISNISFIGNKNAKNKKTCFYINGQQVNQAGAGLWDSSFKNINILRFKGHSMYFEGGAGSNLGNIEYKKVNQFIVFEGVYVESVGDEVNPNIYNALSIAGLNGQFSFKNCRFDGGPHLFGGTKSQDQPDYVVSGINVYLGVVREGDLATPSLINFDTCTFQHGAIGIYIESCKQININGSWFENFERAITVKGTYAKSKGINVTNNIFGRSAGRFGDSNVFTDGSGSIITYSNAQLNVMNNLASNHGLTETVDFIRLEVNPDTGELYQNLGVNTFGNSFYGFTNSNNAEDENNQRYSYGIKKTIDVNNPNVVTGHAIYTENSKLIYLLNKKEAKEINEIISLVSAGELICIRADQGTIVFNESRNIYLGNMVDPNSSPPIHGQLSLKNGGFALFVKSDDGNHRETYNLISYKNRE